MKPVFQTKFGFDGDCFQACIASILELPLEAVPEAEGHDAATWFRPFKEWLKARNLCTVELDTALTSWHPEGYGIGTVKSPRLDCDHAVVTFRDKIVHDPHPGAVDTCDIPLKLIMFLYPLDPSMPIGNGGHWMPLPEPPEVNP